MPAAVNTHRLRIDLAYDGTDFHGWAAQPGLRTVQEETERAIAVLLRTPAENVRLTVGGRTDAGVHARGQVAHLDVTDDQLQKWIGRGGGVSEAPGEADAERLRARRLAGVLTRRAADIAVHRVSLVPADFDARFSAVRRRYEYRLRDETSMPDPLTARFTTTVRARLDVSAMQRASAALLGLRDFTTFCKAREGATAVRTLLKFDWRKTDDGALAATIEADAFCHSMVRALVGGIVTVGSGRLTPEELQALADAKERTSRFSVMPAHGLSLEEIVYPPPADFAARASQTRGKRKVIN